MNQIWVVGKGERLRKELDFAILVMAQSEEFNLSQYNIPFHTYHQTPVPLNFSGFRRYRTPKMQCLPWTE